MKDLSSSHPPGASSGVALPIEYAAASRRFAALFKAMAGDFLLREQFVTDPSQIAAEYVTGERLGRKRATAANTILYAVLSSPKLLPWLSEYAAGLDGDLQSDRRFVAELGAAVARSGDECVVGALIRGSLANEPVIDVAVVMLQQLFGSGGVAATGPGSAFEPAADAGTDMSPGTMASPGTEPSPGTWHSPALTDFEAADAGTEMSPGTMASPGTEPSPGTWHSPALTDFLASDPGAEISDVGTEMSPGTMISPGTGTEMSGGHASGPIAEAVLVALVEYARQLRASGALGGRTGR